LRGLRCLWLTGWNRLGLGSELSADENDSRRKCKSRDDH
jgi:hypothetical protein